MRIAYFIWEYPPRIVGGLGTYAQYITRYIKKAGNDVTVFTPNTGALLPQEVIDGVEVIRPSGVDASEVLRIFAGDELRSWGDHLRFFSSILTNDILCSSAFVNDVVKRQGIKYDVACCHDWLGAMAGSIVKNELGLPLAFHVHSTEWGRSSGAGSKVVNDIEYHASVVADRIVTVSYSMKEDLVRHGWPGEKIDVVWNGIDPDVYDMDRVGKDEIRALRARYGVGDRDRMMLFVGRLNWVKGILNLVQAMPSIIDEFPETKLVILGTGDEEWNIRSLVGRLGIGDNVRCRYEFVSEPERILHYAAADLCAFPSVYEPFGIVSLEGMSMEKPVLVGASGVSGFKEQVISAGDEQTGVHVDGNSPADIAWGAKVILSDMERAAQWGRNGRIRVKKYFTLDKAAKQTMAVYSGMAGRGSER